jgi:hypothetical protein
VVLAIVPLAKDRIATEGFVIYSRAACDYPLSSAEEKHHVTNFRQLERLVCALAVAVAPGCEAGLVKHRLICTFSNWFGFVSIEQPVGFGRHGRRASKGRGLQIMD